MNLSRFFIVLSALLAAGCASTHQGTPLAAAGNTPGQLGLDVVAPQAALATTATIQGEPPQPVPTSAAAAQQPTQAPQQAAATALDLATAKVHLFPGDDNQFKPNPQPQIDPALAQGDKVSLNFENISVAHLAEALLGDLLQLNYTVDAGGEAIVSLHTRQPLPRNQVLDVLDTVLLPHDLVIHRDGAGIYHVTRRSTTIGSAPLVGAAGVRNLAGSGTVIVPLNHIGAAEMAKILTPLATPTAITYVDSVRNLLVLQGSKAQINGWLEMVEAFDVDFLAGMSLGVFVLENANVSVVHEALQAMLGGNDAASQPVPLRMPPQPRVQQPRPNPAAANQAAINAAMRAAAIDSNAAPMGPLSGLLRIFPVERINALIVVTPRSHMLAQVETWVRRLDQPTDALEHSLFVYPVQNGSAVKMAEMLNGLFGGDAAGPGVAAGSAPSQFGGNRNTGQQNLAQGNNFSLGSGAQTNTAAAVQENTVTTLEGNVRIVADASRNALMIRAPRAEYRRIERALRELDRAPAQVLIEASIVEVTLTGNLKYGVEWFIENHMSRDRAGQALLNMNGTEGGGTRQSGFSYTIVNKAGVVRATLNALAASSQLKVLSSPSILVLDNHSANIMVGRQQPVKTSTSISSNGGFATESITYKDTGVMLSVTPSVNTSGLITMDIMQQVTDVGEVDAATQQRAFLARQIETRVAVRSGEPIVLGGVISENETAGNSGVPGLRNIPLLGALFSSTENSSTRTELLVMLTPRILEDDDALRAASHEMRQRLHHLTSQTRLSAPEQLQLSENAAPPAP